MHHYPRRFFDPPHGTETRRLLGWSLFLIGVARALGIGSGPLEELTYTPLVFYGVLSTFVGAALLITANARRLHLVGRVSAVLAAAFCVMMALDFYPNATGVIIYSVWALSLFAEAGSLSNDC